MKCDTQKSKILGEVTFSVPFRTVLTVQCVYGTSGFLIYVLLKCNAILLKKKPYLKEVDIYKLITLSSEMQKC